MREIKRGDDNRIKAIDGDRGEPRGSSPPTPPGIRVRTTAVRSSSAAAAVRLAGRRALGVSLRQPVIRSLHDQHPRLHPDPPSSRPVATGFRPHVTPELRVRLTLPIVRAFGRSFPVVRALAVSPPFGRVSRSSGPTASTYYALCSLLRHDGGASRLSQSFLDGRRFGHGAGLPR